jgi:outer membrane protein assembly factor BamB
MKILIGLLAACVATVAGIWLYPEVMDQYRVMATGAALQLTGLLLLVWLLFLSPFRWKTRLLSFAAIACAIGAFAACFRISGVTGNLIPILSLRWSRSRWDPTPVAPKTGAPPPAVAKLDVVDPLDYPRFLGPAANATVTGARLVTDWKARPPRQVWRHPVGAGWSSFAIASGHAVTQEQRGEDELVVCYGLATGDVEWTHADKVHFDEVIGGEGPRATPTIAGGRVYAVGATGILNCLDGATGAAIWSHDFVKENGAHVNEWGKACSPLVFEKRVIVSAGGKEGRSLVAYQTDTGELAWSGGNDRSGYGSPILAELAGEMEILIFNHGGLAAHDPSSGKVIWEHPWQHEHPNVSQPAWNGNRVLVSSGYGVGCELLEVRKTADAIAPATLWKGASLKSKLSNIVIRDGFAYGLDDGILACIDLADGHRAWKQGRYGHGQLLLVGDVFIVQCESGDLALVAARSDACEQLARISVLSDKTWNHPAFRPPFLLVRNHKEAACYELPLAP